MNDIEHNIFMLLETIYLAYGNFFYYLTTPL